MRQTHKSSSNATMYCSKVNETVCRAMNVLHIVTHSTRKTKPYYTDDDKQASRDIKAFKSECSNHCSEKEELLKI